MKQLLQEVVNYLATRPYQEVYQLIGRVLQELQKLQESENVAKDIIDGAKDATDIDRKEKPSGTKAK